MDYVLHIVIMVLLYGSLAISLNLISGYTGLISLAHASFFGIGAYVSALMALHYTTSFFLNSILAVSITSLIALIIAIPSLRIRDDYFVITTFAFQVIFFHLMNNLISLTGGPMGLPGIPQPSLFGITVSSQFEYLMFVTVFFVMTLSLIWRITQSPYGRVLKAIRDDELFALSVGKNIAVYKIQVFIVGAAIAAVTGAIYAHYVSFIDPTSFTPMESIFILSIVIIGGAGSLWGPIVGAVVLVVLPELLRFVGLPGSVAANTRQIIYGGLLVAFMMWRPQGLLGKYAFDKGGDK